MKGEFPLVLGFFFNFFWFLREMPSSSMMALKERHWGARQERQRPRPPRRHSVSRLGHGSGPWPGASLREGKAPSPRPFVPREPEAAG